MQTSNVETWLPVFSGFYGTYWEPNEANEIDSINSERKAKGLDEVEFNDIEFDYDDYRDQVVNGIAKNLTRLLNEFVTGIKVQRIVSPKYYNFSNDSANVEITISRENAKAIGRYIAANMGAFKTYLRETYTSRSGFISSYPNFVEGATGFMARKPLEDKHKLGAILQFIAFNEDKEAELSLYYNTEANLSAKNWSELTEG